MNTKSNFTDDQRTVNKVNIQNIWDWTKKSEESTKIWPLLESFVYKCYAPILLPQQNKELNEFVEGVI